MSPGPELLPYPKIASKGRGDTPGAREWTATEKVHGAHFALVCDGDGVRPAKRRELLADDALDAFFGVSRVWATVSVAAARCAAAVRGTWGEDAVVTLYGELAGGRYPHPDVPAAAAAQAVQTGVWYAPDLVWLLFDVLVEVGGRRSWTGDRAMREAADAAGLVCVPVVGRGPLGRLHGLPSAFPTGVPSLFGLPELDGNLAEGFVLKPAELWDETASGARPVLKVKQKAFAEDERFAGARPYLVPPEGAAGVPAWLVARAAALLTPARAAGAVSKLGPGVPVDAVAEEIARDAAAEVAEEVGGLEPAVLAGLARSLRAGARQLTVFDAADRKASSRAQASDAASRVGKAAPESSPADR
jgi:Rnl2 family RNA ligase